MEKKSYIALFFPEIHFLNKKKKIHVYILCSEKEYLFMKKKLGKRTHFVYIYMILL